MATTRFFFTPQKSGKKIIVHNVLNNKKILLARWGSWRGYSNIRGPVDADKYLLSLKLTFNFFKLQRIFINKNVVYVRFRSIATKQCSYLGSLGGFFDVSFIQNKTLTFFKLITDKSLIFLELIIFVIVSNKIQNTPFDSSVSLRRKNKGHSQVSKNFSLSIRQRSAKNEVWMQLILLRAGDVELNPGPENKTEIINIMTLNINGSLTKSSKQKITLNRIRKISNSIVMLQETHLTKSDEFVFNARWQHQAVFSHNTNASAGVAILYKNHEWDKVIDSISAIDGRCCYVILEKHNKKFIFVNVYSPNSSKDSIPFWNKLSEILSSIKQKYPDGEICLGGDFNVTLSVNDSLNRIGYANESQNYVITSR